MLHAETEPNQTLPNGKKYNTSGTSPNYIMIIVIMIMIIISSSSSTIVGKVHDLFLNVC